jgi:hypothetical protein
MSNQINIPSPDQEIEEEAKGGQRVINIGLIAVILIVLQIFLSQGLTDRFSLFAVLFSAITLPISQ